MLTAMMIKSQTSATVNETLYLKIFLEKVVITVSIHSNKKITKTYTKVKSRPAGYISIFVHIHMYVKIIIKENETIKLTVGYK